MQQNNLNMELLLKSVLDDMLEGFQVISFDWRYLYVNKTVVNQSKKKRSELIGNTMMECYPGIEKTELYKNIKRVMIEKVSIQMENEFIYPNKESAWFLLNINPCNEGVVILSIEISEKKILEKQIAEKVNELDSIKELIVSREIRMIELKDTINKLQKLIPKVNHTIIQYKKAE